MECEGGRPWKGVIAVNSDRRLLEKIRSPLYLSNNLNARHVCCSNPRQRAHKFSRNPRQQLPPTNSPPKGFVLPKRVVMFPAAALSRSSKAEAPPHPLLSDGWRTPPG
eukprot:EG_transcript_36201